MAFRARRVMRRRAIVRTAAVGGAAYYAGKGRHEADQDAQLADAQQTQGYAPPPPAPPPPAPAAPTMEEKIEQIRQLSKLHDDGILTDDEFAAQKQEILG
jgi:Short C-terminal domain